MVKRQKFEITLKNNRTGRSLLIPVLPTDGQLSYMPGKTQAESINIVNLGKVDIPSGHDLDGVEFSAFFPARYDAGYCTTSKLLKPLEYDKLIQDWKKRRDPIQFIVPAAKINRRMYISDYRPRYGIGAEGDVYYALSLVEYRDIKPVKVKIDTKTLKKKGSRSRPKLPKKPKPEYYVVKKGDWLIKIAKRHGIKDWRRDLYLPNKKPKGPLGPNPDLIYPGQKLKLP
ncbi:LysM peptidoglycan-binding domain-containing protein [Exiguobacterium sp. s181]|uniref:LysM peptidoglycan-binding domain-containing protein n=1 Tax=Exiguobacterium sp. s181 TaxID=2751288 RepID=UPI001BEBF3DA|nr:LysM domain-containing protein [Exiguobacterium sp. s181]